MLTGTGSALLDLNLSYTANGDVAAVQQRAGGANNVAFTNSFSYDGFDRLRVANSDVLFPSGSYNFDSLGRMTNRVISGTTYLYTYGDAAHVDAPMAYHGNSYSYDAVGSQLTGTVSGVAETRSVDPEDRLAAVVTNGGANRRASCTTATASGC